MHATSGGYKKPRAPKSIFITGASSGIGAELAKAYSAAGVSLALTGRDAKRLEQTAAECKAKGANVTTKVVDVTDQKSLQDFIIQTDDATPVDLVIANAGMTEGTSGTSRKLEDATRTLFATNVDGVFNTILPLVPRMKERKSGQIALMSSLSGFTGVPSMTSYAATKAAIKAYGEGLRGLLYRDNVFVTVICPGYVQGPMTDNARKEGGHLPSNLVPMEVAVKKIISGLRRNKAIVAFPFTLYYSTWVVSLLPPFAKDIVAKSRLVGIIAYFGRRREESKKAE
jgi:short-subunit dehydrogenase